MNYSFFQTFVHNIFCFFVVGRGREGARGATVSWRRCFLGWFTFERRFLICVGRLRYQHGVLEGMDGRIRGKAAGIILLPYHSVV